MVTARTAEFGLRLALGAADTQILRLVLGHGVWLVGCGVVLGAAGTLAVARLLESLLRGVNSTSPAILAMAGTLLAVVALAACLGPARRAMRVDPNIALKYE